MSDYQPATQRRPREVWTAAIMLVIFGILGLLLSLLLLSFLNDDSSHGRDVSSLAYGLVLLSVALALAETVSGAFVFVGKEWARKLAIGICVLNAVSGLFSLVSGAAIQAILGIVLNIAIVVALNKDEVRSWCYP